MNGILILGVGDTSHLYYFCSTLALEEIFDSFRIPKKSLYLRPPSASLLSLNVKAPFDCMINLS